MKTTKLVVGAAVMIVLVLATVASAADFSPSMTFELTDTKVGANPELKIHVSQDTGEEELAHVTLTVPKGFKLPQDAAIPNDTDLGVADIVIDVGPRCNGQGPVSGPATFSDRRIYEKDRTDDQADRGVKAVWVVDLQPVTTIPLEVTGGKKVGWKLDGDIPANAFTCPPFSFDATIAAKAGEVPIFLNPLKPGDRIFSGTFTSANSPAIVTIEQTVTITL